MILYLQKSIPTIDPTVWNALTKRLLSVSIRSHVRNNNSRFWTVEIIFFETPLKSKHHREQGKCTILLKQFSEWLKKLIFYIISGKRRPILFQYEMGTTNTVNHTIDSLLNDWSKIVYLYLLVHDFAEQFKNGEFLPDFSIG